VLSWKLPQAEAAGRKRAVLLLLTLLSRRQWAGPDGPAVPHSSRVKVRLTLPNGQAVDRIPAWVRRAVAPQGQMGARFDGVHWAPPQHERHSWYGSGA
jgi:hypothetical protein